MKTASTEGAANAEQDAQTVREDLELAVPPIAASHSEPVELLRELYPGDPTREIVLLRASFLQGDSTAPHRHPGVMVGYVLAGEYEFQMEGQPLQRLTAGDIFYEPPQSVHLVSRNPGETTTQVLAFIIRERGARVMIPLADS